MKVSQFWLGRLLACSLIFPLLSPLCRAADRPLPAAPQPALKTIPPQPSAAGDQTPAQNTTPNAPLPAETQTPSPAQHHRKTHHAAGTAAGPYIKPGGVPASRPAGAAIAPAKQRRIRVIAIRLGLIVGAAIAVGTVAAATLGSPSHP